MFFAAATGTPHLDQPSLEGSTPNPQPDKLAGMEARLHPRRLAGESLHAELDALQSQSQQSS